MSRRTISIVAPCFNEADNVGPCYEAVRRVFEERLPAYDFELIFADNASTDGTLPALRALAAADPRVKVIVNSRNYGPFRSCFNAMLRASGDALVPMLAVDLQDPPELIPTFVERWEQGYQVVAGRRRTRQEPWLLRTARRLYYRLVAALADVSIPPDVGEFQLIDRVVLDALRRFDDHYPYIRGMIATCGFDVTTIDYEWRARTRGVSKNRLYHLFDQALNGLISFSNAPLRVATLLGFLLALLSGTWALVQLAANLLTNRPLVEPGIATLIVAVFFFAGVQLMFLGLLGEYIGAIHAQVRRRPLVIERETINFGADG
jgi:glycosyltransferase involved in cell wall biosynthesis